MVALFRFKKFTVHLLLVLSGLLFEPSGFADSQQSQLHRLSDKIAKIKHFLQAKNNQSENLQQQLQEIELQYSEIDRKLQQIQKKMDIQQQQITSLQSSMNQNRNQLQMQQQALSRQLYLTYILQRQGPIPILLTQDNMNQSARMLYYYQLLNHYRIQKIQQSQIQLQSLAQSQQVLLQENQVLAKLKKQQEETQIHLSKIQNNRSQLLAQINQNISNQQQQLTILLRNKKALEQTITKLSKQLVEPENFHSGNFASLAHHLPWPTKGLVLHYFGKPIAGSELKWNGEIITATEQQPVYAVASGVVVFSKWLEGYGLLIIIHHGNGYMTLYGRNATLLKHEGDRVNAGEMIAKVGKSGGYEKPALYFAIRYNAKPLDPNQWCSS
ncbi:MAG: peptidoglycan DD-metalloendopeptidase family protein [Proteobacteria bacterium]|nr:peptidoglycan DD-metalloendopeptidase family protein [Pseudomonadota bacterium]